MVLRFVSVCVNNLILFYIGMLCVLVVFSSVVMLVFSGDRFGLIVINVILFSRDMVNGLFMNLVFGICVCSVGRLVGVLCVLVMCIWVL